MEFLYGFADMLQSMFYDWPIGTIIGVLLSAVFLMVLGLIAWGVFVAVDSWFQPRKQKVGRVYGKEFTPAHTQMILLYNAATKTSLPHPIFHPDDWSVGVEMNGQCDSISVSKEAYDVVSEDDQVLAEYVTGRLSGGFYLKAYSRL